MSTDHRAITALLDFTHRAIAAQPEEARAYLLGCLDAGDTTLTFGGSDDQGRPYAAITVGGRELARVALTELAPLDDVI